MSMNEYQRVVCFALLPPSIAVADAGFSSTRQKNSPHSSSLGRKSRAAFANSAIWQFRSQMATELIT